MAVIEFVGQSSRDADNTQADPSRLVNCYRETLINGRARFSLKSDLGQVEFCDTPDVLCRALEHVDGTLYGVIGGNLYRFTESGGFSNLDAGTFGQAGIAGNNGIVGWVSGGVYGVWDGSTASNPSIPLTSFDCGSICTVSNYTVIGEAGGRRFLWSDIADPKTLPGTSFSTADGRDDLIVRVVELDGRLLVFKETSFEDWYVTGEAGANAFARSAGGVRNVGLKSHDLLCKVENGLFFVSSTGTAMLLGAGSVQSVSTPAVNTAIAVGDLASCLSWTDEGHEMCAITFRDRPAWVFDVAQGEWHERAEGENLGPFRGRVSSGGYVGRDDGTIATLARVNLDMSAPMVREATSATLYMDGAQFVLREVEMFPRQGFSSGSLSLFLSRDNGVTWGSEKVRMIESGKYASRIIWRALGVFRQATARVRWSDPADICLETAARVKL